MTTSDLVRIEGLIDHNRDVVESYEAELEVLKNKLANAEEISAQRNYTIGKMGQDIQTLETEVQRLRAGTAEYQNWLEEKRKEISCLKENFDEAVKDAQCHYARAERHAQEIAQLRNDWTAMALERDVQRRDAEKLYGQLAVLRELVRSCIRESSLDDIRADLRHVLSIAGKNE
jgi:chromosome segregation ATPase